MPSPHPEHIWQAIVVDDHPMVSRGVSEFLKSHPRLAQVLSASDAAHCLALAGQMGAGLIVIVDFWLAQDDAVALIEQLHLLDPNIRILVMSGDDDPIVEAKARVAGAHGFLMKQASPQMFETAINALMDGLNWFGNAPPSYKRVEATNRYTSRELGITRQELGMTLRQAQILQHILNGEPNKRIAQSFNVSESTIKEHVTTILHKLGVANRVAAITKLRGRKLMLDP